MPRAARARPVLRYHGGKWRLAPWIIEHFPPHRIYVEPFGGGGSVLMRKPRTYAEIYNDLDEEIVNVFRVLRDMEKGKELRRRLELTPFSKKEFVASYRPKKIKDDIDRARLTIIKSFMGFGSNAVRDVVPRGFRTRVSTHPVTTPTGFRCNSNRSGTTPAHDWANYPNQIPAFIERLNGTVIECSDALKVMRQHDRAETLHYCDPPYVHSTRKPHRQSAGGGYRHEMTDEQHRAFAECVHGLKGMVLVSGYASPMYDQELFPDWKREEREHLADGARKRTEVLWMNKACADALEADAQHLLDV